MQPRTQGRYIRQHAYRRCYNRTTGCGESAHGFGSGFRGNNPELHGLAADVAATKGEIVTARTFPNPELTVDPGARQTQGPGGSRSDFHANFALSQLFEFPGKRALKITLAERDLTIRRIALEGFRFQLSTEVRRAFFDLLAADKIVGSRNEQVESARVFSPPHGNVRTEGTRQNLKQ
jgi:Outer membrane efflux protein